MFFTGIYMHVRGCWYIYVLYVKKRGLKARAWGLSLLYVCSVCMHLFTGIYMHVCGCWYIHVLYVKNIDIYMCSVCKKYRYIYINIDMCMYIYISYRICVLVHIFLYYVLISSYLCMPTRVHHYENALYTPWASYVCTRIYTYTYVYSEAGNASCIRIYIHTRIFQ